jgi:hypothetical protein
MIAPQPGISPSSGPATGGTVTIISNPQTFSSQDVYTVTFGGVAATAWSRLNQNQLSATTPAHAAGAVTVIVTDSSTGVVAETLSLAYTYTQSQPVITSVSPTTGPKTGGTVVTITGSGFTGVTAVMFGQSAASSFTFNSDTSITATSPSASNLGTVDITVTTPLGTSATSSADQFTYVPPVITSISPTSGPYSGGTIVSITGTGFTGATSVHFGTLSAAYTINSDTSITATAPAAPINYGQIDITVTTSSGTSATSSADYFTYLPATITSITPSTGPIAGGTLVTIIGTGFAGASAVIIGGSTATGLTVINSTAVSVTTPSHAAGAVNVVITTPNGTATGTNAFTYEPLPIFTSITPSTGPIAGGTGVTITGTGLIGATAVTIGGTAATGVTVISPTTVSAITPAHAAGTVNVVITTPNGTATGGTGAYTYIVPQPTFTSITPSTGPIAGGTSVIITGTGFTGATKVSFGSTANATGAMTVNNDTTITVTTPAHAAGAVNVVITTPGGTATGTNAFTYEPLPTFTSITPTYGPVAGGTGVTITGTGFTGATAVIIGGTAGTGLSVVSDSQITATTPLGSAGAAWVNVTTPNGTVSASRAFTYIAAPTFTSITPASGPVAGGTSVTITGTGFTGTTRVTIGGTAATGLSVISDLQITAITPSGSIGSAWVDVITPNGTAVSPTQAYTYIGPQFTSISPASGPPKGGTVVTISGTGFTGATAVTVGGAAATGLNVLSDTQIMATTPAGTAGAVVNVVIATPNGTATGTGAFTYLVPTLGLTLTESSIPLTLQAGHTATDSSLGMTVSANVPFSITVADNSATLGRTSNYGYMGDFNTNTNVYVSPYTKTLQSKLGLSGSTSGTTAVQTISGVIPAAPGGVPLYLGSAAVTNQLLSPNTFTQPVVITDPVMPTGYTYRIDLIFTIMAQ